MFETAYYHLTKNLQKRGFFELYHVKQTRKDPDKNSIEFLFNNGKKITVLIKSDDSVIVKQGTVKVSTSFDDATDVCIMFAKQIKRPA